MSEDNLEVNDGFQSEIGRQINDIVAETIAENKTESKLSIDGLYSALTEEFNQAFRTSSANFDAARQNFQAFLEKIRPNVAAAVAGADLMALSYLRDATSAHLARVSLGLLYQQREAVTAMVMTGVRLLITLA